MHPHVMTAFRSRLLALLLPLSLALAACPRPGGAGPVRPDEPEVPPAKDPFAGKRPVVEARKDPAADAALQAASQQARGLEGPKAAEAYLSVRKAYPETTAGQEALYQAGVLFFEAKEYARARKAFNELLFENPLFPQADDAKLKLGLSAMETGAPRDAFQTLASLAERAQGEQRRELLAYTARAAEAASLYGEALRIAVLVAGDAKTPEAQQAAVARVEELVEGRTAFIDVARIYQDTSSSNPAWPTLTFKLARIYYHLRDFTRMQETLERFLAEVPNHPYAPRAQEMLARATRTVQPSPRTVGVLLPMSGRYKAVGEAVLRGMQLALQGSNIQLVVKDTAGDVVQAGKAMEDLVFEQGAIAAVGPLLGDEARRAALVAEEMGLPLLTLSRSEDITDIGPYVFRNMLTYSDQAQALAEYATKELGYQKFALLYPDIPYGTEMSNAFWDEVEKRGAQVRGAEAFGADQTSFAPEVKKLVGRYYLEDRLDYHEQVREATEGAKDAFRRRKAVEKVKSGLDPIVDFEAIFMPADWQTVGLVAPALAVEDVITNACDPRDLERIRKTTGKKDLKTVTLLGTDQWRSPKGASGLPALLERGGKFVTCSVYVDGFYAESERPATRKFVQAFRQAHGELNREPFLLEAIGYDAAGMVRQVVEKAKPQTREAFRESLSQVKDFPGATGTTSFNAEREAVKPLFFLTIDSKGVHELEPKFQKEQRASAENGT